MDIIEGNIQSTGCDSRGSSGTNNVYTDAARDDVGVWTLFEDLINRFNMNVEDALDMLQRMRIMNFEDTIGII